jgi:methylmalonyl-CoA mutase
VDTDSLSTSESDRWAAFERGLEKTGLSVDRLRRVVHGLAMEPLYTQRHAPAEPSSPVVRGYLSPSWQIRCPVVAGSVDEARRAALVELEGGAQEVLLVLEPRLRGAGARWPGGIELVRPSEYRTMVRDIALELAGVHLEPGVAWLPVGLSLLRAIDKKDMPNDQARGGLGVDPLASWIRHGALPAPWTDVRAAWARLVERCASEFPGVRATRIDVAIWPEVGADIDLELGCGFAQVLEFARLLDRAKVPLKLGLGSLEVRLAAGPDAFETACKLRAFRRGLERIYETLGVEDTLGRVRIEAMPLTSMFTRRDVPTNIMRLTTATVGSILGGADSVVALPHDHAVEAPEPASRRLARNLHLMLQEESQLGAVLDPLGGSFYVEARTEQMAQAGWTAMQQIESEGGLVQSMVDEALQRRMLVQREALRERVARRKLAIVGVSEYPALDEEPTSEARFEDAGRIVEGPSWGAFEAADYDAALAATSEAEDILRPEGGERFDSVMPLRRFRWATEFEALRDRSDHHLSKHGRRPTVFVATLGSAKDHGPRSTWIQNLLAAGGIEAEVKPHDAGALPAPVVILCGKDEAYEASGATAIAGLRKAGARWVATAGPSVDDSPHVALGHDVLQFLETVWTQVEGAR